MRPGSPGFHRQGKNFIAARFVQMWPHSRGCGTARFTGRAPGSPVRWSVIRQQSCCDTSVIEASSPARTTSRICPMGAHAMLYATPWPRVAYALG
jgi:hypothetical protein